MKLVNFVIIYLISLSTFAQNWALFQPDQGSYYNTNQTNYGSYENYDAIKYWSLDSIKAGTTEEVWYLNSKLFPETYQKCYSSGGGLYEAPTSFDSLLYRNDTLFYSSFYFLPNAMEGESWVFKSSRKEDSIRITYEKKELAEFSGLSDSVKRYSYELIGIHADSTNIDEQSMLLSKHYGLIEYIDFKKLLSPYYSIKHYETIRLVGIEKDGLQSGYQLPSFKTFLPYAAGDILFWNEVSGRAFEASDPAKYHLDTLTEVVEHADSLYYVYNRTSINDQNEIYNQQSDLIQSFVFADFENIVGAKPNLWGLGKGTTRYFPQEEYAKKIHLWHFVDHLVDSENNQVAIARSRYFDNVVDTTLCQTESTGASHWLYFENKRGLVSQSQNFYHSNTWHLSLKGSNINGVEEGSFEVIVGVGRIFHSSKINQSPINITDLKAGIYFFKLSTDQQAFTLKFVKQHF